MSDDTVVPLSINVHSVFPLEKRLPLLYYGHTNSVSEIAKVTQNTQSRNAQGRQREPEDRCSLHHIAIEEEAGPSVTILAKYDSSEC